MPTLWASSLVSCSPIPANSAHAADFVYLITTPRNTSAQGGQFLPPIPFAFSAGGHLFLRLPGFLNALDYSSPDHQKFFFSFSHSPNPLANVFRGIYGKNIADGPTSGQLPSFGGTHGTNLAPRSSEIATAFFLTLRNGTHGVLRDCSRETTAIHSITIPDSDSDGVAPNRQRRTSMDLNLRWMTPGGLRPRRFLFAIRENVFP